MAQINLPALPPTGAQPTAGSIAVTIATDQPSIPVTFAGNVQDFGATTTASRMASVIGNTTGAYLGGAGTTTAQVLRVVLPTDQTAIPATQSGTWNLANITGTITLPTGAATAAKQPALGTAGTASTDVLTVQGIASMTPLKVDGSGVTQPVSGTVSAAQSGTWNVTNISGTVSLPTGASTAAKQPALGTAGVASADVLTVQGIASMTALKVDGSAVTQPVSGTVAATQSGAWNVTNITGTVSLPTGAATAAKQPALGTAGAASADVLTVQGVASMTPLKVDGSAVTQPVNQTTTTAVFQAEGSIAGTALTTTFATAFTTSGVTKVLYLRNSCNQQVVVSLDGGTTSHFVLEAGEVVTIDLRGAGVTVASSTVVQAKHNGTVPTSGSIRVNGVQ